MTQSENRKTGFTGCCGWDFKGPMGSRKEMMEMMEKCCSEEGSFDCSKMMEMFKDKDDNFDVSRMMEMMKTVTLRPASTSSGPTAGSGQACGKWKKENNEE